MSLNNFINKTLQQPEQIEFEDTMAVIEANYQFTPTAFDNGDCQNEAGQNNGSCKILAFGQLNQLTVEQTLACFGRFYRDDVLKNPTGEDHQNIRNFMQTGWEKVVFHGAALTQK